MAGSILLKSVETGEQLSADAISMVILTINAFVIVLAVWILFVFTMPGYWGLIKSLVLPTILRSQKEKPEDVIRRQREVAAAALASRTALSEQLQTESNVVMQGSFEESSKQTTLEQGYVGGAGANITEAPIEETLLVVSLRKPDSEWTEQHSALLHELFCRYDLDGSETINSTEELSQLTWNMLFGLVQRKLVPPDRMQGQATQDKVDEAVEAANVTDDYAFTEQQFAAWFEDKILNALGK